MDLQQRVATDTPLLELLGIRCGDLDEPIVLYLDVRQEMINAGGLCHGGFLYALADTACAYSLSQAGVAAATVAASITYLKPALAGETVTARAHVLKAGRRVCHSEVRLEKPSGELLATFRGTCVNTAGS